MVTLTEPQELIAETLEYRLRDRPQKQRQLHWATEYESADLRTNEYFDPLLAAEARKANPRYLLGVGFGNILTYAAYSFSPTAIQGIFAVDVSPVVVGMARATRHLLKECETPQEFVKLLQDEVGFRRRLNQLDLGDHVFYYIFDTLPQRFLFSGNNARFNLRKRTQKDLDDILSGKYPSVSGRHLSGIDWKEPDIGIMLLQHYPLFRRLATEGRIGILESDIGDRDVLEGVARLKNYQDSNNIVYLSNLPNIFSNERLDLIASATKSSGVNIHVDGLKNRIYVPIYTEDFSGSYEFYNHFDNHNGIRRILRLRKEKEGEAHTYICISEGGITRLRSIVYKGDDRKQDCEFPTLGHAVSNDYFWNTVISTLYRYQRLLNSRVG